MTPRVHLLGTGSTLSFGKSEAEILEENIRKSREKRFRQEAELKAKGLWG